MDKHRRNNLSLDSEYRDHYQRYYLADGTVADSRTINWRQLDWEKVVKIETRIRGQSHTVECSDPRFEFFMVFRWFGQEWIEGKRRQINVWTQGWSDGVRCYLSDIDFKSGAKIKDYVDPLSKFEAHVHPRVTGKMRKHKKQVQNFGSFLNAPKKEEKK